jgi:hypothetical protein
MGDSFLNKRFLIILIFLSFIKANAQGYKGYESGYKNVTSSFVFEPEALIYFSKLPADYPSVSKYAINSFIYFLKNNFCSAIYDSTQITDTTLWDAFDQITLYGNYDTASSVVDLKGYKNALLAGGIGSSLIKYKGLIPASNKYINLKYNLSTDPVKFQRTFASMCIYSDTNNPGGFDAGVQAGSYYFNPIIRFSNGNMYYNVNTTASYVNTTNSDSRGFYGFSAYGGKNWLYKNGIYVTSSNVTFASSLPNYEVYLGCVNNGGTASTFAGRRYFLSGLSRAFNGKDWRLLNQAVDSLKHNITSGQIVCDGNSITQCLLGYNLSYPHKIDSLLQGYIVYNKGVGSRLTETQIQNFTTNVRPLYDSKYRNNIYIPMEGICSMNAGASADSAYRLMKILCDSARAQGWEVWVCTCTSWNNEGTHRQAYNDSLIANYNRFATGIIRVDLNEYIGATGSYSNTHYFYDNLHLTELGNRILASIIFNAIRR